jgi:cytochrome c biogenesis factor
MSFFSGYSSLYDLNTRVSINDAYLGTYYFWWTNMTYLPFFFFLTLLAILSSAPTQLGVRRLFLVWVALLLIYPLELYDYISANLNLTTPLYHTYGLNTLLTNVLNRYHPFVFYTSVFILAQVIWAKLISSTRLRYFETAGLDLHYKQLSWLGILINLLALWMGSWWALQEGTWGGWWNWDSSEVFGLLLSLILLNFTHSRADYSYRPYTYYKAIYLLNSFIISYFFIQLNFELVSHNFGSKFFFFFNNNLFFSKH